jgi:predicted PurR-regulated permease PerM
MEFLSLALVIVAVIFTAYPPKFTFIKEIHVINPDLPQQTAEIPNKEDLSDLNDALPPSLDDLMKTLNESIHDIVGGEDNE